MTRFRYRYATYSYLLFVCLIPIVTSISVDENGSKASSNPSAFDEEQQQQLDQLSDKTYLTSSELKLFRESLNFIKDDKCRRDLNATLWGLLNNVHWAVSSKWFSFI